MRRSKGWTINSELRVKVPKKLLHPSTSAAGFRQSIARSWTIDTNKQCEEPILSFDLVFNPICLHTLPTTTHYLFANTT